jgi:hypothetical protein
VRDTTFDGNSVKKGDLIGLVNNHLSVSGKTVADATIDLVRKMIAEHGDEACTVTLYFGEGQTEEDAQTIADKLQEAYEDAEFMVLAGGQPLYYYYVAVQ